MVSELKDKFKGTLFGVAIGDALGNPLEGMTPERIVQKYGEVIDYQELWEPKGTFTDDTELTLCTAKSLIKSKRLNLEDLANRFIRWLPDSNSFGITCQSAIVNLKQGKKPHESGINSPGNGGAMRVSPLGLVYSKESDTDKLYQLIKDSTKVTHDNPQAIAGALAVGFGLTYLIRLGENLNPMKMLDYICDITKREDIGFSNKLSLVRNTLNLTPKEAASLLGTSSNVLESVPFALYCFLKNINDFEDNLVSAINAGGDTDTNASITGAFSGCYHGAKYIPKRWILGLREAKQIKNITNQLFRLYQSRN